MGAGTIGHGYHLVATGKRSLATTTIDRTDPLTQSKILRFFLPLALSWVFMAFESPISTGFISRLPHPKINTAAFAVMMSLALWIESPVIDLLSTATTLAKGRLQYFSISRFVHWLIVWVTLAHMALTLTPLYDFVALRLMQLPPEVASQARLGLILMIPWSGCIGWRRYLQGILIRFGQTRLVGIGTAVRVATMFAVSTALFVNGRLDGIQVVAIGLVSAVAAEASFAHWASRRTIREQFGGGDAEDPGEPLSYRKLASFHLPLTVTTMVMLFGFPLTSAALARAPFSVLALASYQVANTRLWMMRTTTMALPEVVITLYKDHQSSLALRRFSVQTGLICSGILLAIALSGLDRAFFIGVLGTKEDVAAMAHVGLLVGFVTPTISGILSYMRGILTAHHLTVSRMFATTFSVACLFVSLAIGVRLQWMGVVNAGVALTVAMLADFAVLLWAWKHGASAMAAI